MSNPIPDIAVQIAQEHACLNRDMGEIMDEINKRITDTEFANWRLEFTWRLRDFRNHLLKHFDLEEEGGFMADILLEKPEALARVRRLEIEHDEILSNLDDILIDLKVMVKRNSLKLAEISNRLNQLIETIRNHESAEQELMQAVYYREYGYPAAC